MVQIEQDYYRMLGVATEDSMADIIQQAPNWELFEKV